MAEISREDDQNMITQFCRSNDDIDKKNMKVYRVLLYYFGFVSDNGTNRKVRCYYMPLTLLIKVEISK